MGFVRVPVHVYANQPAVTRLEGLLLLNSKPTLLQCMPLYPAHAIRSIRGSLLSLQEG